jgi:hypothetical protein
MDHLPVHRTSSSLGAAQPLFIQGDCRVDFDAARLHCFRHLSGQVELKQAVLEGCVFNLDIIGKVETPLERASRDALVEIFGLFGVALPARYDEQVLLRGDIDIGGRKTCDGEVNAEGIFTGTHDVIRG